MKKYLIIHAGCHKTGTSALQKALKVNGELLNSNFIHSVVVGNHIDNRDLTKRPASRDKFWADGNSVKERSLAKIIEYSQIIVNKRNHLNDDIYFMLSAESLSWLFRKDEVSKIYGALNSFFTSIKVVFYIRRQDKLIRSHHKQGAITTPANVFYGNSLEPDIPLEPHFDNYLDFAKRINLWVEVFGESNVIVRVMDKNMLYKQDITLDFFEMLGLKNIVENINISNCREVNTHDKVDEKLCRIYREIGKPSLSRSWLRKLTSRSSKSFDFSEIRCSSDWSKMILDHFCESNKQLSKQFNLGDNWYQYDSINVESSWEWTEEESNAIIGLLLGEIKILRDKINNLGEN